MGARYSMFPQEYWAINYWPAGNVEHGTPQIVYAGYFNRPDDSLLSCEKDDTLHFEGDE